MLIRSIGAQSPRASDITPELVYFSRREFITALGLGSAALALPAFAHDADAPDIASFRELAVKARRYKAGGETVTPFEVVSTYNNYYEFGTDKDDPHRNAGSLITAPWTVTVNGECEAPATIDVDTLYKNLEERVYRHRCVEAWSIVVPWVGFGLGDFLKRFKPTSKAKYVRFETLYDSKQMPRARWAGIDFPYEEGLRIDEAMHPLSMLTVGMYGRVLPNQNGAPLRLTVPWKYGFKSIKSIVKISFVERMPRTTWNRQAPDEYGFYANVNPQVSHPRWSQAKERRLGELFKRETLMFNGYPEVASLYTDMNLRRWY